jgi:energy-converting hydrogenase Eha subunit E
MMAPLMSAATKLWTCFSVAAKHYPFAVNSITGCSLCAGSDAMAQYVERYRLVANLPKTAQSRRVDCYSVGYHWFDKRRFASAGLIGVFVNGLVYPRAYAKLDSIWAGVGFSSVLQKSLVELATVGIFVNTVSMTSRGLLGGRDRDDVVKHVYQELPTITVNDVRVWLPYNLFAFTFIPAHIRPSTTALMEAIWQTYISLRSNNYANGLPQGTNMLEA